MPVEHGTASRYAQEMRKWNAHHSEFGPPGRPFVFCEFPKMVYLAARVNGAITITERKQVGNEDAELIERGKGFRASQEDAIALIADEQKVHGTLAAEREWEIQHGRLSAKAIEEVRVVEAGAGAVHVPMIPEGPKKKRGRPRATAA